MITCRQEFSRYLRLNSGGFKQSAWLLQKNVFLALPSLMLRVASALLDLYRGVELPTTQEPLKDPKNGTP